MRGTRLPLMLMILAVLTLPTGLLAQTIKIGVVDMERAIVGSVEGKKAEAAFRQVLERFYAGSADPATDELLRLSVTPGSPASRQGGPQA